MHLSPNVGWRALGESVSSNWFNGNHQVVTNYDALGQMTTYTYDPSTLQLTSVTRPSGLATTNLFDANHRLETTIGTPIDRTNSFTWNSSGDVATFTDERNMTVTKFWDGLHRPTGSAYPDGTTTTNLYTVGAAYPNSSGGTTLLDLTATQDRLGKWTEFAYDSLRRKTCETNANGIATTFGYCECGALTSVTRGANTALDETTTYVLDDEPRLTQIAVRISSFPPQVPNHLDFRRHARFRSRMQQVLFTRRMEREPVEDLAVWSQRSASFVFCPLAQADTRPVSASQSELRHAIICAPRSGARHACS
jgi:YD repeat-containing protein